MGTNAYDLSLSDTILDGKSEVPETVNHAFERALGFNSADLAPADRRADLLRHILELVRGEELDDDHLREQAYEASMGLEAGMVTFTAL